MQNGKTRSQKYKRKLNVKKIISMTFFSITIGYLSINLTSFLYQLIDKSNEKLSLENQLSSEEAKYLQYEKDVSQLQIPEYLAKYARERYSLSKEGEIIFKTN